MKFDKKTANLLAGMAGLFSAGILTFFSVMGIVSLIFSNAPIPNLGVVIALVSIETLLTGATLAFALLLFRKGEGKLYVIVLLALFAVQVVLAVLNLSFGSVNAVNIIKLVLAAVSVVFLILSSILKDGEKPPEKTDKPTDE